EHRLALILLVVLLPGELQAAAAGLVEQPLLAGAQRALAGEMLARHDVLAIRRPRRIVHQSEALLRYLRGVAVSDADAPDVVAAAAIRGERDFLAVRREARLHVPGAARGQRLGMPTVDRQQVEVAEQV